MHYTIQQFLDAAYKAGESLVIAEHICDVMAKMNEQIGTFRKLIIDDIPFFKGEVVKVVELDKGITAMSYKVLNAEGIEDWLYNHTHEPTTETF